MGKTLRELDVKPGDVVEFVGKRYGALTVILAEVVKSGPYVGMINAELSDYGNGIFDTELFRIISRAPQAADTPKLWRDMTDEEQGALLLASHRGKVVEYHSNGVWCVCTRYPIWQTDCAYRIRPEPKVEAVMIRWQPSGATVYPDGHGYTHRITFNIVDGKPDPASIKMEAIK